MKKYYKTIIILVLIALGIGYWIGSSSSQSSTTSNSEEKSIVWTCSMHPQIQLPEFGQCPICFMDLIPLEADGSVSDVELKLSESAMKLADIGTTEVIRAEAKKHIKVSGKLDFDETRVSRVTAWTDGRIEKLFIDYTGKLMESGERIMEFYSQELFVAQQEFLLAIGTSLESVSSKKLQLLGLTIKQIEGLKTTRTIQHSIDILSQSKGTVVELNVSEGDYVKTGSPIATIVDLSNLWLLLDVHESDIALIQVGQKVTFSVNAFPGSNFEGYVSFIHPTINHEARTVSVRVDVENTENLLKPEMFTSANIQVKLNSKSEVFVDDESLENPLIIPKSAVMKTGERVIVYVMKPDSEEPIFELREVVLGHRIQDDYIILEGLVEGESVVSRGTFKIDSAMQLEAKPSMMSVTEKENTKSISISNELLEKVLHYYFSLQEHLADDNFESAYQSTMDIHKLTMGVAGVEPIMEPTMRPNMNITELRNSFRDVTEIVRQVVREQQVKINFEERFCPAPDGGYWLQKPGDVKNPYFGKDMVPCHAGITWENSLTAGQNK